MTATEQQVHVIISRAKATRAYRFAQPPPNNDPTPFYSSSSFVRVSGSTRFSAAAFIEQVVGILKTLLLFASAKPKLRFLQIQGIAQYSDMAYVDHAFSITDEDIMVGTSYTVNNRPPIKEIALAVALLVFGTLGIVIGILMAYNHVGGDRAHGIKFITENCSLGFSSASSVICF